MKVGIMKTTFALHIKYIHSNIRYEYRNDILRNMNKLDTITIKPRNKNKCETK